MTEYKRARTHTYLELQAMQSKQRKHDNASERLFKKAKAKAKANMNILGAHIRLIYAYLYHGNTVFIKLLSFNVYIKIIVQHTQFFFRRVNILLLEHINIVRDGMGKMCVKLQMNY